MSIAPSPRPLCPRAVQVWVVARYESWLGPLLGRGWGATAASYVHRKV